MSLSLTTVFLPPAKPIAAGSTDSLAVEAAHQEMEYFRAELLRQKIIFEGELRRQREVFEDRLETLSRQNKDREEEVKQLRQTLHALTLRLDLPNTARPQTPRRAQSPNATPRVEATPATSVARPASASLQRRPPSPSRTAQGNAVRPFLTVVSRASSLARLGSVSEAPWK